MDRILLVNPPDTAQTGFTNPPLGLLYLAGTLLAGGFQVKVVDACLDGIEAVDQALHEFNPMMVGITCLTPGRKKAVEVGDRCKRYNSSIKVVIGGVHPTIMYRQMLEHYKCIDYLVLGEGEQTFLELARGIEPGGISGLAFMNSGTVVKTARRELIQDLDQIPFPAWHLIDLHRYPSIGDKVFRGIDLGRESRISVIFSRGCKGHCDFCSTWWIWRGWRHRSPKNMVDELELLSREHGIRHFCFADDALTVDREATICLCDEIVARGLNIAFHATTRTDCVDAELLVKLARAGCYNIAFGVETGSAVLLDRMNKENEVATAERAILLAKDAGITTTALIIVGNIGETTQTIEETVRFLKRAKPDIVGCAGSLWILPGTRVFQECKKIGFIDDDFWLGDKPYKVYDLEWSISQLREMEEKIYGYQNVSVGEVMASEKYPSERPSNIPPKWDRYFKPEVNEYSATTEWIDAQPQHLALMKLLPPSAIDVLDLGCGDGWSTHTLLGMGKRATGVTVNPKEAEHAMQRYGIDLVVRDMHDLPFTDHTFDAVYCRECYEHSIAPYIALCEMNRVLKLSGHALINLPWDGWIREDSHFSVLTPAQMREMFFKCRFVVEREGRTPLGHYWYLGRKVAEMTQSHPFSPPVPGKKWLEGMVIEPILSPEPKQQPKPPRIICQMRIKNEDRWIQDVLDSIAKVAQGIIILDDGSTDRTQEICKQHPAVLEYYWQSEPVIDEVRDKNRLIKMTLAQDPDWILCMDGDEIFEDSASERICEAIRNCPEDVSVLDIEFLYMWNDLNHYRVDGIYGRLFHHRLFKLEGQDRQALSFTPTAHGGNFHCESVPPNICGRSMEIDVKIKHLGYMYRADREHKYYWYKSNDTVHAVQGYYEHLLDQPEMALAEWNERPISYDREATSTEAVGQTLVPKQEVKPNYYYANARRNIADLVPQSARRVLDVGCGQGLTGGLLRVERGIEVVGVELHSEVAEIAKSHLSRVVIGDLESMDLPFDHGYFDCIIFADVLEHLVNPWGALQKVVKYLSIGGTIIASIPNIRNLDVLSKLAGGTWGYTEQGIMDRTHLRFFALADMFKLFEDVGIQARVAEVVRDPVFASMDLRALFKPTNLEFGRLVIRDATPAEVEEWTTIQFIFTGTRVHIGEEATPKTDAGLASVVIPVFNNFAYTKQCIESLFTVGEITPFEVIVVDDASTDGTADRIQELPFPVQVMRHSENRGFAASCNDGARQAKGRFVVFLNNDTIVLPGWLDAMVARVESDPTIGLVGNLQIFPDSHKVQQAGIVCGEGKMAYSIYHNDLPADHPAVNKPREFQLIAGSCMLLEREFFFKLGCFDEVYLNSCEDVDLCMQVRSVGRKVFYEPKSRIYHFDSKTVSGHSKTGSNYMLFLQRWGDSLVQDDQQILEEDGFRSVPMNLPGLQEVVLIAPPRNFKESRISGYSGFSKNLGLGYLAAVLRDRGIKVSVVDAFAEGIDNFMPMDRPNGRVYRCGLPTEVILSRIPATARWVGINVPFSNVAEIAFDLARTLKARRSEVQIVLGGVHPSTFPEACLQQPGVDFVIAGEGEFSLLALVQGEDRAGIPGLWWRGADGVIRKPAKSARVKDLNEIPFPAWDLLPMERYFSVSPRGEREHRALSLITSRGCPYNCTFCSVHPISGRNWRARSPENVLAEVAAAVQRFGINHLEIEDDNFTLDRTRALAILRGLRFVAPGLTWAAHNGIRVDTLDDELLGAIRDSGCRQLNLAIEHGSPAVLKAMNKKLSLQKVEEVVRTCGRLGIPCVGFCIVGHPGEDATAFRESYLFFQRLRLLGLSAIAPFIVNAYPGTELHRLARENGWLFPTTDQQLFFLEDAFVSVTTPDFDRKTVLWRQQAMKALSANP
jgi:radical SAM superfamily enzyme YgiQ (UPF0313 family)/GT2 family glycosyltransferase/SAM-dependent methyltransferase